MRLISEYDPGSRAERSHQRAARRHGRRVDDFRWIDGDWGTVGRVNRTNDMGYPRLAWWPKVRPRDTEINC
jgi:hypothetical protein